jgi:hypothetical protein
LHKTAVKSKVFSLAFFFMVSATLSAQGLRAQMRSQVTLRVILDPPGNPAEKKKVQASENAC